MGLAKGTLFHCILFSVSLLYSSTSAAEFFFSLKGATGQGSINYSSVNYKLQGTGIELAMGWKPMSWAKIGFWGNTHPLKSSDELPKLNNFTVSSFGGFLRLYFIGPFFLEGGSGTETFASRELVSLLELKDSGTLIYVSAGIEVEIQPPVTYEIFFRQHRVETFDKALFEKANFLEIIGGFTFHF